MTAALEDVVRKDAGELSGEDRAAAELVRQAKEPGLSLTGPDVPREVFRSDSASITLINEAEEFSAIAGLAGVLVRHLLGRRFEHASTLEHPGDTPTAL